MPSDSPLPTPFIDSSDALDLFASDGGRPSNEAARNSRNPDPKVVAVPWSQPAQTQTAVGFSLDRIRAIGPLQFVEAVALVQAVCDKVSATPSRGIPELTGIFLTEFGDVIASGPPSAEPGTRQAARLLHQLVAPENTPAAARLFIGRWTGSDSASLSEFASELAYFARPNGPELRATIYALSATNPSLPPVSLSAIAPPVAPTPRPIESPGPSHVAEDARMSWLHSHRRQVIGATAVGAAVLAAGLTVWIWPSSATGEPAPSQTQATQSQSEETTGQSTPATDGNSRTASQAQAPRRDANPPSRARNSGTRPSPQVPVSDAGAPSGRQTGAADQVLTAGSLQLATTLPVQASRDTRIYTAADAGVEPPTLRSAEIPEWLIQGFVVRQNSVEILIDERGDVQRVKMIGAPQRMPDVMLLSRAKEWVFTPATKDGVPVRYRLLLSWNVTP